MDPPKEMTMSDVTEDSVIISWIKPMAPFEYYKLSYQSARGNPVFNDTSMYYKNKEFTNMHAGALCFRVAVK